MKATICNQWEMELPEPAAGTPAWFLDWVLKSPRQAGQHLACSYRALESLLGIYKPDDIDIAWEPFGGIGAQALMIEQLFGPAYHLVGDYALQAVEHMKRVLPPQVDVWQADAYKAEPEKRADLAALDFGDLTVWKAQPDKERGQLLDKVFASGPKAVTITDVAARYLHLQKKSYEPLLGAGTCESYEGYLHAFSRHLTDRYGYVLHEAHYTRWSGVMAFIPETLSNTHSGRIYKLPTDYPGGLTLG